MKRRAFLAAAGSTGLAGCSYQAAPSTTTADGDGGDSTTVDEFRGELEAKGVAVDSTMTMMGSVSVMYYRRPAKEAQDLTRIAVTYAEHIEVSEGFLALTALEADGESRYATYDVDGDWARDYSTGELSKEQYVANIRETETLK